MVRMQSQEDYKKYLDRIYGGKGKAPGMSQYRQYGRNRAGAERAEKRRKELQRQREKQQEDKDFNDFMSSLAPKQQPQDPTAVLPKNTSKKQSEEDEGFLGSLIDIPLGWAKEKGQSLKTGFQALNPFDDVSSEEAWQNFEKSREKEADSSYRRLSDSMLKGATAGFLDDENVRNDGALGVTGQIAGSLLPGGLIAKGLRGTRFGANIGRNANWKRRVGQTAKEGAVAGGLYGAASGTAEQIRNPDADAMDFLKTVAFDTAGGAVLDPALSELFTAAGRGASRIGRNRSSQDQQPQDPLLPTSQDVNNMPRQQRNDFQAELPSRSVEVPTFPARRTEGQGQAQLGSNYRLNRGSEFTRPGQTMPIRMPDASRTDLQGIGDLLNFNRSKTANQDINVRLNEARKQYADERMDEYTLPRNIDEIAHAETEWQTTKQLKDEYQNVFKQTEKFYVPDELKEEIGHLVPKSFVRAKGKTSQDIYKAAEDAGYGGDAQGVLEYANYLARLFEAKNTRKSDLVPEADYEYDLSEDELNEMRRIFELEFDETPEAQDLLAQIDTSEAPDPKRLFGATQDRVTDMPVTQPQQVKLGQNGSVRENRTDPQQKSLLDSNQPVDNPPMAVKNDPVEMVQSSGDQSNSLATPVDKLLTKGVDDLHMIKKINRLADNKAEYFYRNARLVRGASASSEQFINTKLLPMVKELQEAGGDVKEFTEYLNSLHLLDVVRNRRIEIRKTENKALQDGQKINTNLNYELPNNVNIKQLEETVRKFKGNKLYNDYRQRVRGMFDEVLDMMEESQIVSPELRKQLNKQYPNYMPLFRQKGIDGVDQFYEQIHKIRTGNTREVIKELGKDGSDEFLNNPIDNIAQYIINAHHSAFSNRAMMELDKLSGVKINGDTIAKKLTPKQAENYKKANVISFYMNGEKQHYYVQDDLNRALTNLKGIVQIDEVLTTAQNISKFQRMSITANPFFALRQIVRDIPQAYTVGKFSYVRDVLPAFLDTLTKGKFSQNENMYQKFMEHGAGMSNIVSQDRNSYLALQKAARKAESNPKKSFAATYPFKEVVEKLRKFNEALENTPKMAQFRATARRTGDYDQAAFEARDIMDFSMAGETTRTVNRYAAFVNANIQGKSKMVRSFNDRPLETGMKTAMMGAVPSLAAYMAYETFASDEQKAIIDEAPSWQKQTYWLVPNPSGEGVIQVPKPYEVAVLSSTPIEFLLQGGDRVGVDVKDDLWEWGMQAFAVDLSLNPATPVFEAATGIDMFTDRSIIPQREQGKDAGDQGDVYTPSTAQGLSALTGGNVSPRILQHLMEGYAPIVSETANDGIDRLLEVTGQRENVKPEGSSRWEKFSPMNLLGLRPIEEEGYQANEPISALYDSRQDVQQQKRETLESGQPFEHYDAYSAIRESAEQDGQFTAQIRAIDNDPTLSREQKAEMRNRLIQQRNQNVRQANELGMLEPNEQNLNQLEQQFDGLSNGETLSEIKTRLSGLLEQNGVPPSAVTRFMTQVDDLGLTRDQLAKAAQQLLSNYQN